MILMNKKQQTSANIRVKSKLNPILFLTLVIVFQFLFIGYVNASVQIEPFKPQIIDEGEIPYKSSGTPASKEYKCYLEAGHKYHIFLVGDWVTNNTKEATDYDVEVRNPNSVLISINTEAAGLPEQVANDEKHQYFIPTQSGDYTFRVINDPEDSAEGEAKGAIFMIIEHIELNTRYSKMLYGKPYVGADYPPRNSTGYEFNTSVSEFLVYIEVPDPVPADGVTGLDMYEARIYPMANPGIEEGYIIQGIGVPFGVSLNGTDTNSTYGRYNTSIPGYSFPDMRISCESAGVDMKKKIIQKDYNSTEADYGENNVFYYMVLLAEYFEGEIEFYIKTDYRDINMTLINPPRVGYSDETTLIKVEPESASPVDSMWIEYTNDGWKTSERIDLIDNPDYWLAILPEFALNDFVEYKIHAEDEIDNKGSYEGNFTVMNKVEIDFGLSGNIVQGGQTVRITGAATRPSINLQINVEHGGTNSSINVQTDGDGVFTYDYTPTKIGEYDITISYAGDEDYHKAVSREKSFRVDKRKLELVTEIENNEIKIERPMTVSGQVTPAVSGLEVEFIFVSSETSFVETVSTDRDGRFSVTIIPDVLGYWDMLPQLKVSELYDASQGSMTTFEVVKLTPVDIITYQAMKFTEPPLMYVLIGVGVVLVVVVLQKTGILDRIRGGSDEDYDEEEEDEEEKPKQKKGGATAYKRRSAR